jgi:predicted DNA-binding transcriptional regulator AlpA
MEKLFSLPEVAALLGASPDTLRYWRKTGQGPKSFKLGRRVVYSEQDISDWITEQRELTGGAA